MLQQPVDCRITCLTSTYYEESAVSARHQHIRVSENSQWRGVDDDVIKHTSHFRKHPAVAGSGKQFGDIVSRPSTRQQVEARWFETNDGVFNTQLTAKNLRETDRCIDAEIVSGAGAAQVAIDHERAHAFSLGPQPRKVERRQRFAFGDTGAGDDNRAHLQAFAGLENSRAQRAKLLGVRRARLADRNQMRLDARRRAVKSDDPPGARRSCSAQSCPSITRSNSVGECRPAGYIRSVRSGR